MLRCFYALSPSTPVICPNATLAVEGLRRAADHERPDVLDLVTV
jgi:hypothetical protein